MVLILAVAAGAVSSSAVALDFDEAIRRLVS
jgi:hypothetical protein